nr:hypothetical protein [Tanacetum cinerariifolium]
MVINSPCLSHIKNLLVQEQTALVQKQTTLGKDESNLLIVDSLLKNMVINAPCDQNEALAIPEQTAAGKENSNPLMADSLPITILLTMKKVVVTEDIIRQDLQLDDADGVECLPTEEIFAELARMGYEKPPPKLTFYKAFFSAQWKILIHTLV